MAIDLNDQAFKRMRAELEKRYHGKHIAIANGQLVAVADTYDELVEELRRRKIQRSESSRARRRHLGVGSPAVVNITPL